MCGKVGWVRGRAIFFASVWEIFKAVVILLIIYKNLSNYNDFRSGPADSVRQPESPAQLNSGGRVD